MKVTAVGNFSF